MDEECTETETLKHQDVKIHVFFKLIITDKDGELHS